MFDLGFSLLLRFLGALSSTTCGLLCVFGIVSDNGTSLAFFAAQARELVDLTLTPEAGVRTR